MATSCPCGYRGPRSTGWGRGGILTRDVLDAAQVFGADVDRVPVEVNTVDNPVLLDDTQRGWSQY